jgi:hypothetical protein
VFIEHWWNDSDRENLKYLEKNCPIAIFVPKRSTWTALGLNSNVCIERLANNCMTSDAALLLLIFISNISKSSVFSKTC